MLDEALRTENDDENGITRVAKFRKDLSFVAFYDAELERSCAGIRRRLVGRLAGSKGSGTSRIWRSPG